MFSVPDFLISLSHRDPDDDQIGGFVGESQCEFQCGKPEVIDGYLSSCSRPLDGATCDVTCTEGRDGE